MDEQIDWKNAYTPADLRRGSKPRPAPLFDPTLGRALGVNVPVNDPRLIRLVVKYTNKDKTSIQPDRLEHNQEFLKEAKETFSH